MDSNLIGIIVCVALLAFLIAEWIGEGVGAADTIDWHTARYNCTKKNDAKKDEKDKPR